MDLLFQFIYMTDFSKSIKSNEEHELFVCFELCLTVHAWLLCADREQNYQFCFGSLYGNKMLPKYTDFSFQFITLYC